MDGWLLKISFPFIYVCGEVGTMCTLSTAPAEVRRKLFQITRSYKWLWYAWWEQETKLRLLWEQFGLLTAETSLQPLIFFLPLKNVFVFMHVSVHVYINPLAFMCVFLCGLEVIGQPWEVVFSFHLVWDRVSCCILLHTRLVAPQLFRHSPVSTSYLSRRELELQTCAIMPSVTWVLRF